MLNIFTAAMIVFRVYIYTDRYYGEGKHHRLIPYYSRAC